MNVSLAGVMAVLSIAGPATSAAVKQTVFVVRGPTIVAFFPPVKESDLSDGETNEVLGDFQIYTGRVRDPLRKMEIEFHEVYAHSFRIRLGKRITTFRPGEVGLGFYFIAPGKKPRVEYGVQTDIDILEIAKEYFPDRRHSRKSGALR